MFLGIAVGANGNSPSKNKAFQTASNYYLYPCKQALYVADSFIDKFYNRIEKNDTNLLLWEEIVVPLHPKTKGK